MTITQFYSLKENFDFVNAATNSADKAKRIAELRKQFERSNFSGGDGGDEADFFAPEKAETALFDIKRLVARSGVQESIKKFLLQRNSVIAANKAKQKEKEKEKQNKHISHPNWY
jgi:hypothetical protein